MLPRGDHAEPSRRRAWHPRVPIGCQTGYRHGSGGLAGYDLMRVYVCVCVCVSASEVMVYSCMPVPTHNTYPLVKLRMT